MLKSGFWLAREAEPHLKEQSILDIFRLLSLIN